MLTPKVSVIVPIYKVEDVLKRCVDTLITQTLKEIEIILVNDGSPDNCPKICDDYAKRDKRIKVIHKKNGGLSDARNVGLIKARGDYVLFVDSDDYIIREACEVLYNKARKDQLDIVAGNAIRVENDKKSKMFRAEVSHNKVMNGQNFLKEQLKERKMYMAAWLNLYRKEFLISHDFYFKKGIYHEDEQWTPRIFLKANKVSYINLAFYYYNIRDNSITQKRYKTKNGIDLINTCYELEPLYKNINDKELRDLLNDYLVMLFLNAIHLGNLYNQQNNSIYNKKFLIGKPKSISNKLKVLLFILNKHVYKVLNDFKKTI